MPSTTVKTRQIDIRTLVYHALGAEREAPTLYYEFSNGRKFYDKPTPRYDRSGRYRR